MSGHLQIRDAPPSLAASANELRRATGALHADAADLQAVPGWPRALTQTEDALDRLQKALQAMAAALAEGDGARAPGGDTEALQWHLAETAARLRSAGASCSEATRWSRSVPTTPAAAALEPAPRMPAAAGSITQPAGRRGR